MAKKKGIEHVRKKVVKRKGRHSKKHTKGKKVERGQGHPSL